MPIFAAHVQGGLEEAADAVTISTIHKAKGLEWRAVVVMRCNKGHLPMDWWPPDGSLPRPDPPADSPYQPPRFSVRSILKS